MKNTNPKITHDVSTPMTLDEQARGELLARIYRLILSSDWAIEEDEAENEVDEATEEKPAG